MNNSFDARSEEELRLSDDLSAWFTQSRCSREQMNSLLSILNRHDMKDLPLDCRTLLKTPRTVATEEKCGGTYCYIGIAKGIKKCVEDNRYLFNQDILYLKVNIDGLPLSKSSKSQLWPILGSLNDTEKVFEIAVYHGTSKPNSCMDFLEDFIHETQFLQEVGLEVKGKQFSFCLTAFIM